MGNDATQVLIKKGVKKEIRIRRKLSEELGGMLQVCPPAIPADRERRFLP
jgi:hypothetical protein